MAFEQNSMAKQNGVDSVPNKEYGRGRAAWNGVDSVPNKEYNRERVAWNGAESVPNSENGEDSGFSTSPISNADFQGQFKNLFLFLLGILLRKSSPKLFVNKIMQIFKKNYFVVLHILISFYWLSLID